MTKGVAWHRRLPARVLFFLLLALLPLGIIGVVQNAELFKASERQSELSLLALTERAASGERQLIERTFGAVEAVGAMIDTLLDEPEACRAFLQKFQNENSRYAFVGFLPKNGITECSTVNEVIDFSGLPNFADYMENPRPNVEVNLAAPGSGESVLIVNQPRFDEGGALKGYVSISIPLSTVGRAEDFLGEADPITLVTFNAEGQLLSAENGREDAKQKIPANISLKALARGQARTFTATSSAGNERVYGVIPIVPDVIYALSSWRVDGPVARGIDVPGFGLLLPLLMWLASLLVAWLVIDRVVMSRVSKLAQAIERFARDRTVPRLDQRQLASTEMGMLETAFAGMAEDLLQDEAEQEERIREKSILLKEVHHRVKNNLQIISSIMNMQIRKAHMPETKRALSQVQDRIMGLSGVHRTLYQATNLTQINAATLIEQIVEQSRAIGGPADTQVQITKTLDPVIIYPDQAVPLSMLVAEALTNAMKYIGTASPDQDPKLDISLKLADTNEAHLSIKNTRGAASGPTDDVPSTGLGQQLIRAFSTQLNGDLDIVSDPSHYEINIVFKVDEFKEAPLDY